MRIEAKSHENENQIFTNFLLIAGLYDIKFEGIGAIFMGLQPIHQLSNRL